MENVSPVFDDRSIRHTDVAYEVRDLNHEAVFYFFLVLGIVIFLVYLGMWGMFKELGGSQYAGHATTNPMMTSAEQLKEVGGDPANSFPMPQLQPDPVADLNKFRIREEQLLNTYGWVDQAQGKIHIPIETAIDVMAASWPPHQESSTQPAPSGSSTNADSDERGGNYGW